jgi:hypothetical protein
MNRIIYCYLHTSEKSSAENWKYAGILVDMIISGSIYELLE